MTRKAILLSTVCFALSGCITDKVSMSSEVGGSSAQRLLTSAYLTGPSGPSSNGTIGGLGVTGDNGVIANVIGADLVGGLLDASFGQGNFVSDLLGSPDGSTGFVPALAGAAAGSGSSEIFGPGAGISGDGGVISDIVGTDLGGALLGSQGIIPASVAGGNDGLLGALLADENANPTLTSVAQLLPISSIVGGYSQVPSLGVTGSAGVGDALLGNDVAGNIAGSGGILGGGSDGALAGQVPLNSAPLGAVGQTTVDVLNIAAGNTESPLAPVGSVLSSGTSTVESGTSQVLSTATGIGTSDLTGAIAPLTQTLSGITSPSQTNTVLAPVTNTVTSLPTVGSLLTAP